MNIKDALKGYPDDKKLKVGSFQSYFYVGTVGDFRDNMAEISGELFAKLKAWTEKKQDAYDARIKRPPSIEKFIKIQEAKSRDFTVDAYLEYINLWLAGARGLLDAVQRSKQREERFKPLSKRQVRDRFDADATVDPDCLVLIVEGEDLGSYWLTSDAAPGSVGIGSVQEGGADE